MFIRRWLSVILFAILAAAAVTGLVLTRVRPIQAEPAPVAVKAPDKAPGVKGKKKGTDPAPAAPRKERLVDESPLQTARRMVPLAYSRAERELARQAERLANHEVDLAFSDALRRAQEEPPPPTPQTQELIKVRDAAEAAVEQDRKDLGELERKLAAATARQKAALEDQVDVAKAELELDQDELEQASEALDRVGGDPQSRIQRLKAAHNAVEPAGTATPPPYRGPSLLSRLLELREDTAKLGQLRQAHRESLDKGRKMTERRVVFAQRVEKEGAERSQTKQQAAGFAHGEQQTGASSREEAQATLKSLQHFMADQRRLANFGRRIQDQQELAEVYSTWVGLAEAQQRVSLHAALRWVLAILGVILAVLLSKRYFDYLFHKLLKGADRIGRLPKMAKFAAEAVGALTIIFLIFGVPSQMTTVFGLAGAGLTVALKDFIMAFFGWFILVGRNGIHVGDWVEIKGVGGEVVEIGLLRTLIMETGNWSDASHPTGRIASFVNSFAMEGHFFNFSTAGQWMWDELRVMVPKDQDPYPFIDAIRTLVEKATEANAELAQTEWSRAARKSRSKNFSALPAINVVPTGQGFEIRVRYLTHAYERHETQHTLNQALLELMVGKRKETTVPANLPE